ncbi:MAG: ABC transporter ATP-binding protein [Gemmatimonadetes bacterium]|mgnify:CR=1 FL=1|nr:ABC transporter ATP-binding protein [Gemmatimonadota bacterium]MBT7598534.1 ABC transporter ATP-binding protein [Gemmatimonadota bacterium]
MRTLTKIVGLLWPYRMRLLLATVVAIASTLLALPGPYLTKVLIDEVAPGKEVGLLVLVLVATASSSLFLGLTGTVQSLFSQRLGALMGIDFQQRLLRRVQAQDLAFFNRWQTGEILARFDDMDTSLSMVISLINSLILNGLYLLVFPVVLLTLDWELALLSLVVLPVDAVLVLVGGRVQRRYARLVAEQSAQLQARSVELIGSARLVQSLSLEVPVSRHLGDLLRGVSRLQMVATALGGGIGFTGLTARTLATTAYAWVGWNRVIAGDMTAGTFIAFSSYVGYLYGPIQSILSLWPSLQVVRVHGERFLELLDLQPQVQPPVKGTKKASTGKVCFEEVVFGYGDRVVLDRVSLQIEPGESVAICGESGVGKSTLGLLIPRFHDPHSGRILVDAEDVRRWDLPCLRRQARVVLQGSPLFSGTVLDNVTLGREVLMTEVERAAEVAQLRGVIDELADGWSTPLGEHGVGLSEGQKQRLGLARAMLMQPPVLILDEPTAALDARTARCFGEALREHRKGKTTIVITHQSDFIGTIRTVVLESGGVLGKSLVPNGGEG